MAASLVSGSHVLWTSSHLHHLLLLVLLLLLPALDAQQPRPVSITPTPAELPPPCISGSLLSGCDGSSRLTEAGRGTAVCPRASLVLSANPAPPSPLDHVTCLCPMSGGCETRRKGRVNNASQCGNTFTHEEALRRWTVQVQNADRAAYDWMLHQCATMYQVGC